MELFNFIILAKLFGSEVVDWKDLGELAARFIFNLLIAIIIVRFIYYPITKRKNYLFTYLLLSVVIFFLCNLLSNVKISLGFALGLFAIFGIIRYRTGTIAIKEMTYLFIVIGISAINALANKKISHGELLFTNLMVVAITYGLEKIWLLKQEARKTIIYEKIDFIKPENHHLLLEDLRERTGLPIHRFQIGRVDFLRDTARIRIFFYEDETTVGVNDENDEEGQRLEQQ
ncbi:MAG: DUF4956 domain-containing protein [Flavobacteriales bacterium]|nr:MAG: DUF4956 domain-containing protein [Flavobacteriales bacterium]